METLISRVYILVNYPNTPTRQSFFYMGNKSNPEQWAVQERLRFIERAAYWRGWVQRSDLMEVFGKGSAQVSADFQKYLEINPGALAYSTSRKRYEGQSGMKQVLQESRIEDAVGLFLEAGRLPFTSAAEASRSRAVEWVVLPERRAVAEVERRVFQAIMHRHRLRLRYMSLHGNSDEWRWIQPHALAHSGHRWHVRAWCAKNRDYRDFTLGRIAEADWPVTGEALPSVDVQWDAMSLLTVRPAASLSEEQKAAVMMEYGMKDGMLRLSVREAMRLYVERQLGLAPEDGLPPRLERVVAVP